MNPKNPPANHREIRIDILGGNPLSVTVNRSTVPKGLKVSGAMGNPSNSLGEHRLNAFFFTVAIPLVQEAVSGAAKDVTKEAAKKWLIDFISSLNAKRIRIQGREPKDQADLEQFISEEIEIGRNDSDENKSPVGNLGNCKGNGPA